MIEANVAPVYDTRLEVIATDGGGAVHVDERDGTVLVFARRSLHRVDANGVAVTEFYDSGDYTRVAITGVVETVDGYVAIAETPATGGGYEYLICRLDATGTFAREACSVLGRSFQGTPQVIVDDDGMRAYLKLGDYAHRWRFGLDGSFIDETDLWFARGTDLVLMGVFPADASDIVVAYGYRGGNADCATLHEYTVTEGAWQSEELLPSNSVLVNVNAATRAQGDGMAAFVYDAACARDCAASDMSSTFAAVYEQGRARNVASVGLERWWSIAPIANETTLAFAYVTDNMARASRFMADGAAIWAGVPMPFEGDDLTVHAATALGPGDYAIVYTHYVAAQQDHETRIARVRVAQ